MLPNGAALVGKESGSKGFSLAVSTGSRPPGSHHDFSCNSEIEIRNCTKKAMCGMLHIQQ